jgi:hypothetical protein
MLNGQKLSGSVVQFPATLRVSISMLGGRDYFSTTPRWNKDRKVGG